MTEPEMIEPDDLVAEPMAARPTKRDLIERGTDALDIEEMSPVKVSAIAGGVSFATIIEVMDFAKMMAVSGKLVPKYLRGNPGGCLGITFQAIEWRMSPFQVANKSYEVNDRVGYESQLIHAVIEARAPLQHRLDCQYEGEIVYVQRDDQIGGNVIDFKRSTRRCIVRGMFTNGDVREYTSPTISDIRVKNSPLWIGDPDQQLFYYASRSWARKWCPDVLMGIYSREELQDRPDAGREGEEAAGLQSRLAGSERPVAGYNGGHTARELAALNEAETPRAQAAEAVREPDSPPEGQTKPSKRKRASELPSASDDDPDRDTAEAAKQAALHDQPPVTVVAYKKYANAWIKRAKDLDEIRQRWTAERKHRNDIGMTADDRAPLEAAILKRRKEWE